MKTQVNDIKFHLFSTCINVKGFGRSIIYDIQRKDFDYIPDTLSDILEEFSGKTINDILNCYGKENEDIISEYFDFLIDKEYIFFSNVDNNLFPKYGLEHNSPFKISNLILDVSEETFSKIDNIYNEIEVLGCGSINFRFKTIESFNNYFEKTINKFSDSRVRSIDFFMPFIPEIDEDYLEKVTIENNRIFSIHVFSAVEEKLSVLETSKSIVFYHTEGLTDSKGSIVDVSNFIVNIEMFVESNNHNTYYNKKIYIDDLGKIKNTPVSLKDYGNIGEILIKNVLENPDIEEIWKVKKDIIKICKDCEFRYMCVDSRLPNKLDNGLWELEGVCNYDPYTNLWRENV